MSEGRLDAGRMSLILPSMIFTALSVSQPVMSAFETRSAITYLTEPGTGLCIAVGDEIR